MSDAHFVGHEPCPKCSSRNNLARYSDGGASCFTQGCGYYERATAFGEVEGEFTQGVRLGLIAGEVRALEKRGIDRTTCEHWQYQVGEHQGRPCQIANYADDDGVIIAQKIRFPDKTFTWTGEPKKVGLYGQHLWRTGGRKVVITEGEIDALTVSQLQQNKWPVVSIPNGAQGAAKSIAKSLEWLEKFDSVVFMFDMDEPGQEAAKECAMLLTPGKAFIARLPLKDANECLTKRLGPSVIEAMWAARPYRPDGVIAGADLTIERLRAPVARGAELPYPKLNETIRGLRKRELVLLTAGSGIGKSTLAREIGYHLVKHHDFRIGNVFLEESVEKTANAVIALDNNVPLIDVLENPDLIPMAAFEKSKTELVDKQLYYDHFGSLESENLLGKLRFMAVAGNVDFIVLDHISMVVADQEGSGEGERKDIDRLMTRLRSLIEQTGVGIIGIIHLKRASGKKSFNEGGAVAVTDLRGSASLEQLSDIIIAGERDQQDENNADRLTLRVLKNRPVGITGLTDTLQYQRNTGRLVVDTSGPFKSKTAVPPGEPDF